VRSDSIDTIFRVRLRHRPGELARLTAAIAEQGGLLGEITTVRIGEGDTIRDITIETSDEEQTRRLIEMARAVERDPELASHAITEEMLVSAAEVIASLAEPGEVVPSPLNPKVHEAVCQATARRARELGLEGTARTSRATARPIIAQGRTENVAE